jgi:SAM-dependent methyltransferase
VSSLWNRLSRPLREARWWRAGWSASRDREFHDDTFAPQQYDPFSPSYPGYLTIRRFADLAEAHLAGVSSVVDLGCGPGEITCELARRHPAITFLGVDHSAVGVERARHNAARLRLTNIRFTTGDIDTFVPDGPIDLIVMFDAFHHLQDPASFVARVRPKCARLFLIEPAGIWTGQWNRDGDVDWLPAAVFEMADRLEYVFDVPIGSSAPPAAAAPFSPHGAPTEHRYTIEDFERFFSGYALDFRGTIAGLERHGSRPLHQSPLRDRFADAAYRMVASVEDALYDSGLDLAAKHWAIRAERDGAAPTRKPRIPKLRRGALTTPIASAYGVEITGAGEPTTMRRGAIVDVPVRIKNTGWRTWSESDEQPVRLGYHWLDESGAVIVFDGLRTPFAAVVAQGETVAVTIRVQAPRDAGQFVLAIDLVHEGVTWFSQQGVALHKTPVAVL